MADSFDEVYQGLAALKAEDFDDCTPGFNGLERLDSLTTELRGLPNPERGIRALFDVMERMPDADLGSPGPLVHTLEALTGYELELAESIKRMPTPLAVWMINRILNVTKPRERRDFWINLLQFACEHPKSSESVKDEALHFVEYQKKFD